VIVQPAQYLAGRLVGSNLCGDKAGHHPEAVEVEEALEEVRVVEVRLASYYSKLSLIVEGGEDGEKG
jgi:hypothetical protein